MDKSSRVTPQPGLLAGAGVAAALLVLFAAWPRAPAGAVAKARPGEPAIAAVVARPATIRRSGRTGHLRIDFNRQSVPTPPGPGSELELRFEVQPSGVAEDTVSVSPYLVGEGRKLELARLAPSAALRVTLPGGGGAQTVVIPISPCFDRSLLARLSLFVDPLTPCRIDAGSVRIEAAPAPASRIDSAPALSLDARRAVCARPA